MNYWYEMLSVTQHISRGFVPSSLQSQMELPLQTGRNCQPLRVIQNTQSKIQTLVF